MKIKLNPNRLPALTAGLGLLAMVLRMALFLLGRDEKNLLVSYHPLSILVWAVTAAATSLVILHLPKLQGAPDYARNFRASSAAALGAIGLAIGICATVVSGWNLLSTLDLLCSIFGLLAVPALVLLALHRRQGKQPFFLLHGVVCIYLTLFSVSHYQIWSSRPQIQDWFFTMGATILLTLFAYCQTAFDADMGNRRMQISTGLLATFFCLAAVAGGEDVLLYLTGALWAVTNLCRLVPPRPRRKNSITEAAREDRS